jgi:hypothetical protein
MPVEREGEARSRTRTQRVSIALMFLLAAASCENLAAGRAGQAEVVLTGNGPVLPQSQVASPFEGTVTTGFRVYLESSGGFPFQIASRESITVDLTGDVPVSLGSVVVSSGVYNTVRVVFSHVMADVTSGLGGGGALDGGQVTVDFQGAQSLQVEEVRPILVDEGGQIQITVELRAPEWIEAAVGSGSQRVVPAAVFRDLVAISSRHQ